jgi:hypothetical protein
MKVLDLFVGIQGDISELTKSLSKGEDQLKAFVSFAGDIGDKLSKNLTAPLVSMGKEIVKAAADSEKAQKSLQNALKATGKEVDNTTASIVDYAAALQDTTAFEDDAIVSASALLVQLGDLDKNGLQQVLPGVLDFAEAMGVDLQTAAQLVAKTLGSGTNALARYGIDVDATASKSDKLAQITEELGKKFGGAAEAAGQTFSGKLANLQNTVGDLAEEFGKALLPVLTDIIDFVKPIVQAFAGLDDNVKKFILTFAGIAAAIGPALKAIDGFQKALTLLQANPVLLGATALIAGISALTTGINALQDASNLTAEEVKNLNIELSKTQGAAQNALGPVDELTASQKLNKEQVDELIKLYPQLTGVIKANETSTLAAAEAVRLAGLQETLRLLGTASGELSKLQPYIAKYNGVLAQAAREGVNLETTQNAIILTAIKGKKEYDALTSQIQALTASSNELSVSTIKKMKISRDEIEIDRLKSEENAKKIKENNELALTAEENAKKRAEAEKKAEEDIKRAQQEAFDMLVLMNENALTNQFDYWKERVSIAKTSTDIEFEYYKNLDNLAIESADDFIALTDAKYEAHKTMLESMADDNESAADDQIRVYESMFSSYSNNVSMISEQSKIMAAEMITTNQGLADAIDSIFSNLYSALETLATLYTDSIVSEIERERDAALEAAGVEEDTKLESLQKQLDKAIEKGDTETANELRVQIEREEINTEFNRRIAQEEYEGAKFAHSLQVLSAVASAAGAVLSAFASVTLAAGPIAGAIAAVAAGIFGAVQIAAVAAAAPKPPQFAMGTNWAPGGMALVGEQGPELVNLPNGASVLSNARTESILNNNNQQMTYNFYSPKPLDEWQIKKAIMRQGRIERMASYG